MNITTTETVKIVCEKIRIKGIVQGVGFRPTVSRIANECELFGEVRNDANGVLILVSGSADILDKFIERIYAEAPPLARIDSIKRNSYSKQLNTDQFRIVPSTSGEPLTGIAPDAGTCGLCIEEIFDSNNRRFNYPFTNCTHCGPRFTIINKIPYDRINTSMKTFKMCEECNNEYQDLSDRRFHAQPNACPECGPQIWLENSDGEVVTDNNLNEESDINRVCSLLAQGKIIAIKGIGGFHLACDALNEDTVKQLRQRKQRYDKPFAMMASNIDMIRHYCDVNNQEESELKSASAPIVLLKINQNNNDIANAVAPEQNYLGFMLPYSPLHHLILNNYKNPIVLTSANISDEPQCIENDIAKQKLNSIADYFLFNDRDIVNRMDDSVVRIVANDVQFLRRARGYSPAPINLPEGFSNCPEVLAMGGELKNTFCFIKNDQAIVSQHFGDLENAATFIDYCKNLNLYHDLYQFKAENIATDLHPDYLSSKEGIKRCDKTNATLNKIQHHHAHIASCMAENNIPLNTDKILGVALDGLGFGEDNQLWGGEFLLADYVNYERLATFKPIAMPGGMQAIYEPWRNTYAHIVSTIGWKSYKEQFNDLGLTKFLESKQLVTYDAMLENKVNSPLASSCGRLFDAVAAAIDICREKVGYEGQAAIEMEAIVDEDTLSNEDSSLNYSFSTSLSEENLLYVDPTTMWQALFKDLSKNTEISIIAARFHKGLADAICRIIREIILNNKNNHSIETIALSGGVFQNKILTELVISQLKADQFSVILHRKLPTNDGGLALGQAVIAAARSIAS